MTSRQTRRTTLTLPVESLRRAERLAKARNVNLSVVVAEALQRGLQQQTSAERAKEIIAAYRRAFEGFSDEEMMILDGIIPEREGEGVD